MTVLRLRSRLSATQHKPGALETARFSYRQ
ncbi:UNVERIFIED_CONTAM: hypothetical protein GTU68_042107 [Idotea baltica]|nr:hypothetical protein [Idotea baltica]